MILEYITTPVIITMFACVVSYFWGKYQTDPAVVISVTLDALKSGGYIKTKIDENGEEELIKLDD